MHATKNSALTGIGLFLMVAWFLTGPSHTVMAQNSNGEPIVVTDRTESEAPEMPRVLSEQDLFFRKLEADLSKNSGQTGITISRQEFNLNNDFMQLRIMVRERFQGEIITRARDFDPTVFLEKATPILVFDQDGRLGRFDDLEKGLRQKFALPGLSLGPPSFLFELDIEKIPVLLDQRPLGEVFLRMGQTDMSNSIRLVGALLISRGHMKRVPVLKEIEQGKFTALVREIENELRTTFNFAALTIELRDDIFETDIIQLRLYLGKTYVGDIITRSEPFDKEKFMTRVAELLKTSDQGIQALLSDIGTMLRTELKMPSLHLGQPQFLFDTNITKYSIYIGETFIGDMYMRMYPIQKQEILEKTRELLKLEGY